MKAETALPLSILPNARPLINFNSRIATRFENGEVVPERLSPMQSVDRLFAIHLHRKQNSFVE